MKENDIYIIDEIIDRKIAEFIKQNRKIKKKELVNNIEKLLKQKDEMYKLDKEKIKKILENI